MPHCIMATAPNDTELLNQLRKRDERAYRELYRNHYNMVKHLVVQNSGAETRTQDVFQEAIIVLYENVRKPGFKLTSSIKTYLYSICRNLWLKQLRSRKKDAKLNDFEAHEPVAVEQEPDPTDRQLAIMNACLEKLGDPCRKLLTMFYYAHASMEAIANELGYTNAGNAKNQKYKCLQRLRKLALEQAA